MRKSLALLAALSASFLTAACTTPISAIDQELRASLDELQRAGDSAVADLAALDPLAPPPPTFAAKRKAYKASLKPTAVAVAPAAETPPAAPAAPANGATDPALAVPALPPLK